MRGDQWARLKLLRSWTLFGEVLARAEMWNEVGDFTADVRVLEDRSTLEFLTSSGFRPPITEWALLVGDAIHNARSALDAGVWELAHAEGAIPANPARVGFPVTRNSREWVHHAKSLESVPSSNLEKIRLAQPWVNTPSEPQKNWLSILARLDNDDKHRGRLVAVPFEDGVTLNFAGKGIRLGTAVAEGGYFRVWGPGLVGTESAGTPFARLGLGALIEGHDSVVATASVQLVPAVSVLDQVIPVAALRAEMLPFLRRLLDEVMADGTFGETTIFPTTEPQ